MQELFNAWAGPKEKLLGAGHILLCADFDGTIIPIKPRPEEANLGANMRLLLRRLSKDSSFSVGIISGRALKDIKEKVGLRDIIYAGNHGLEIACKGENFIYPEAKRYIPLISKIAQRLTKRLSPFPRAYLERKRLSLSLHYRLVKRQELPGLRKVFFETVRPYLASEEITFLGKSPSKGVKLTFGKKVWELRPPIDWDKGKAVLWLVRRLGQRKALTIYIGDDLTDEDAFGVVNKINGLSILVGRRKTSSARYYLKCPKDVQNFLEEIEKIKRCQG